MTFSANDIMAVIAVGGVIAHGGIVWWRVGAQDKNLDELKARVAAIEKSRQEALIDDLRDAERRRSE